MSRVSSFRHPLISDLDSPMDLEVYRFRLWHRLEVDQVCHRATLRLARWVSQKGDEGFVKMVWRNDGW